MSPAAALLHAPPAYKAAPAPVGSVNAPVGFVNAPVGFVDPTNHAPTNHAPAPSLDGDEPADHELAVELMHASSTLRLGEADTRLHVEASLNLNLNLNLRHAIPCGGGPPLPFALP